MPRALPTATSRAVDVRGEPIVGHCVLDLAIGPRRTATSYAEELPMRRQRQLVAGPVLLRATFFLLMPPPGCLPERSVGTRSGWNVGPLDLAERASLIVRALATAGYIRSAEDVALQVLAKRWGNDSSTRIYLRTLLGGDDIGVECRFEPGQKHGQVHPLPAGSCVELCPATHALIDKPITEFKSGGGAAVALPPPTSPHP